jgi:nucleotide-binding universal stress UspA family protein
MDMSNLKNILIYTDFTKGSSMAIKTGLEWTLKLSVSATIFHIPKLNSITKNIDLDSESEEVTKKFTQVYSNHIKEKLAAEKKKYLRHDIPISTAVINDNNIDSFNDYVINNNVSLLVLPIIFNSYDNIFFSDSIEKIIRTSKIPVLIVRDNKVFDVKKVVFPFDFDLESSLALSFIEKLSSKVNLQTQPVHISKFVNIDAIISLASKDAQPFISDILKRVDTLENSKETKYIASSESNIKESLGRYLDNIDCDLVIMGSSTKSTFQRLTLGSVAEYILRHSKKSILISKV